MDVSREVESTAASTVDQRRNDRSEWLTQVGHTVRSCSSSIEAVLRKFKEICASSTAVSTYM